MKTEFKREYFFDDKAFVALYNKFFKKYARIVRYTDLGVYVMLHYLVGMEGSETGTWYGTASEIARQMCGLSPTTATDILRRLQEHGLLQFKAVKGGMDYAIYLNKYRLRGGPLKGYELDAEASLASGQIVVDWPKKDRSGIGFSYDGGITVMEYTVGIVEAGDAGIRERVGKATPESGKGSGKGRESYPTNPGKGRERKVRNIGVKELRTQRVIIQEGREQDTSRWTTLLLEAYDSFVGNTQSEPPPPASYPPPPRASEPEPEAGNPPEDSGEAVTLPEAAEDPPSTDEATDFPPVVEAETPPPVEEPAADEGKLNYSQAAVKLAKQLLQLTGWTTITNEDLKLTGAALYPLVKQHGDTYTRLQHLADCITWATQEKFWEPMIRRANLPGKYFFDHFVTIHGQFNATLRTSVKNNLTDPDNPKARLIRSLMGDD